MGATRNPFLLLDNSDAGFADVGGIVKKFKAGGTLLIGDAVYLSAEDTVNKATGVAGGNRRVSIGIVVGGSSFTPGERRRIATTSAEVGSTAAATNGTVLVLIHGVAWAVADAAVTINTAIALGATTAGRVDDVTFAAGDMLGIALDTATQAADKIKVLVAKI